MTPGKSHATKKRKHEQQPEEDELSPVPVPKPKPKPKPKLSHEKSRNQFKVWAGWNGPGYKPRSPGA